MSIFQNKIGFLERGGWACYYKASTLSGWESSTKHWKWKGNVWGGWEREGTTYCEGKRMRGTKMSRHKNNPKRVDQCITHREEGCSVSLCLAPSLLTGEQRLPGTFQCKSAWSVRAYEHQKCDCKVITPICWTTVPHTYPNECYSVTVSHVRKQYTYLIMLPLLKTVWNSIL